MNLDQFKEWLSQLEYMAQNHEILPNEVLEEARKDSVLIRAAQLYLRANNYDDSKLHKLFPGEVKA